MKNWSILSPAFGLLIVVLHVSNYPVSNSADPTQTISDPEPEDKPVHARQAWIQMDKDLKSAVGKMVRKAMPTLMKEIYKKEVSAPCMGSLMGFTKALRESKLWAYKSK